MHKDNARRRGENPAEEHPWVAPEEIAASAPHYGSREELTDALRDKGWAMIWLPLGPLFADPIGVHPRSDRYTVWPGATPSTKKGRYMLVDHDLEVMLATTVLPTLEEAVELLKQYGE